MKTITLEQEQALYSLNKIWVMVEMISRTFADDKEPESRDKLLAAWYLLEDTTITCRASIMEAFSQ